MNSTITIIVIALFIVAVAVRVALIIWDSPQARGKQGENIVKNILSQLPSDRYYVFNDTLLAHNGHTTQIDHIVVSPFGIFVFETKNYSGWISGNDQSEEWKKTNHGKSYRFQNPVRQNYGHVRFLKEMLGVDDSVFRSAVVFTINSNLSVKTNHAVIYTTQLLDYIYSYRTCVLKQYEVEGISTFLSVRNITDESQREFHVQRIQHEIYERDSKINMGICPKCSGKLVVRTGQYGQFYGCSNYPDCKYKKPIE